MFDKICDKIGTFFMICFITPIALFMLVVGVAIVHDLVLGVF